jgi:hypothetical protein
MPTEVQWTYGRSVSRHFSLNSSSWAKPMLLEEESPVLHDKLAFGNEWIATEN